MRKKLKQTRLAIFKMILAKGTSFMSMGAKRCPSALQKRGESSHRAVASGESEVKAAPLSAISAFVVYIARKFDNTGVGLRISSPIGT